MHHRKNRAKRCLGITNAIARTQVRGLLSFLPPTLSLHRSPNKTLASTQLRSCSSLQRSWIGSASFLVRFLLPHSLCALITFLGERILYIPMSLLQSLSAQKPARLRSNTMDTAAETRRGSATSVDEGMPVDDLTCPYDNLSCTGVTETRPTFAELTSIERHRREILLRVSNNCEAY